MRGEGRTKGIKWIGARKKGQRRYDTRHKMLTQRALFASTPNTKKGTLSQQFVKHVAPPLEKENPLVKGLCGRTREPGKGSS